jgi:hypothetical protein
MGYEQKALDLETCHHIEKNYFAECRTMGAYGNRTLSDLSGFFSDDRALSF